PKTFISPVGKVGRDSDLFMQWKFKTHRGMLLVVGGEEDALAAYPMLQDAHNNSKGAGRYDGVAVVSSVVGEGGASTQLRTQYTWLSQFNKIIVAMDNDEAGRKAEESIVSVLPKGKAFVMRMREDLKDPSDYLMAGRQQDFLNDFWSHRPYTMDGVKSSFDAF